MASRQGMIRTTIALGIALTLGAPLTASAQAGGGAGPAPAQQGGGAHTGRCTGRRRGGRGGRSTVHARGRRPGPALSALQLGLASGHAAQRSGTRYRSRRSNIRGRAPCKWVGSPAT